MARFYESRNIDDSQAQYRIVVRTPDGKRTEINLPRQVFEGIEELQREFWRTERRETRHSLHLASMDEASLAPNCLLRACPMMIPRVADTHSTRCR